MLLFKKKANLPNQCPPSQTPLPPLSTVEVKRFISEIHAGAETHRRSMAEVFHVVMDYTPESLDDLDELISRHWRKPPPQLEMMVHEFGCYVGQTFRRLHGGEWTYCTDCGWAVEGIGGHDLKIYPFAKVRQRFLVGKCESLGCHYDLIRGQVQRLSCKEEFAGKIAF